MLKYVDVLEYFLSELLCFIPPIPFEPHPLSWGLPFPVSLPYLFAPAPPPFQLFVIFLYALFQKGGVQMSVSIFQQIKLL